ncbi:MAG: peptide-methionine (S)-S-oxide reductase MsrA [Sphingobium sp.]|uniref:peptide-methionine (S)-S-oxide reductase MsrA n=1 Tax=Sphingobium sp. TaxID=1912891 RepID=UPI0029B6ECE6|nr:peptide-methionine (S)-S-oxide reductase MsrA [Sphingobium sp.]MDX3908254.1 peptide-methionine (S)-S-oxide reductase MsrA [Sphingobium sp.]
MMGTVWHFAPGVIPVALAAEEAVTAPAPRVDVPAGAKLETAVFAGGCYWGVEGVFSHVKGVRRVESGFAGGPSNRKVDYDMVSNGDTGFAEAVRVSYDPRQVSYGTLMRVFFSVIADPTALNYQGPDHGTQYRSALFPLTAGQTAAASAYLTQLGQSGLWRRKVVTKVERFSGFQLAGSDHQNFMANNPRHPYILRWDAPKLAAFKQRFPQYYSPKWAS